MPFSNAVVMYSGRERSPARVYMLWQSNSWTLLKKLTDLGIFSCDERRHNTCSQDINNMRDTAPERAVGKALLPLRRLPTPTTNVQQELFERADIISHLEQRSLRELYIVSISESRSRQAACIDHYVR